MKRFIIYLFLFACLSCAKFYKPTIQKEEPKIKILLLKGVKSVTFSSPSSYLLKIGNNSKKEVAFREWTIRSQSQILELVDKKGKKKISHVHLPVIVEPRKIFFLNGSAYRGKLILKRASRGLLAINEVSLEEYLRGVVPCEMGSGAPFEALRAQAVAARTYALANLGKHGSEGYDLSCTVYDQVYKGVDSEAELTDRAVAETRGMVLEFHGKPIEARYHSTCGGKTADAREIFSRTRIPYLRSVDDRGGHLFRRKEPFCASSPHFRWSRVWKKNEFYALVEKSLSSLFGIGSPGKVRRVKATKTKSGRVRELVVITSANSYRIYSDQVRDFLGNLPSTKFDIIMRGNLVKLEGRGFGHGLGMCQWGAMGMAREGHDFKRILRHYYPGTRLKKLY